MYFPYLRGRQSELLAIRTLLEKGLLSDRIIPVIEPIKPTATFRKTLEVFTEHNRKLCIISNPQVGDFNKEITNSPKSSEEFYELLKSSEFKKVTFIKQEQDLNENKDGYIMENTDHIEWFIESKTVKNPSYLFIPDQSVFRRNLRDRSKRVLQADHFRPEARNTDYLPLSSRPFTSDHIHYKDEGYFGFSDYSIVGARFMEGGFAPRAVAIHIVYFTEDNELRIRHFTSETNDDITNPAGKFHEALEKLVKAFKADERNQTYGLKKFIEHYESGTYPGLGSAKQLSIMHHIELISNYLRDCNK